MQRVLIVSSIPAFTFSPFALIPLFCNHIKCADERHLLSLLFVGAIKLRRRQVYSDFWAIRVRVHELSERSHSNVVKRRARARERDGGRQ